MVKDQLQTRIEQWTDLDRVANPLNDAVRATLDRVPRLRRALRGEWLGHPLHAAITDLPVGAWSAGLILDAIGLIRGTKKLRTGADAVHAIGLLGSFCAAAAGLADWSQTRQERRRLGFVHGVTNLIVAGLFGGSLYARARKRRGTGIALAGVGYVALLASAWMGGELTYALGVGIRDRLFGTRESEGLPTLHSEATYVP